MISKAKWQKYVDRLAAIDDRAAAEMERYIDANGLIDDKALIDYAYALATKYGEASAELACEMYDLMAQTQGARVPAAVPAETATYGEVAKNVGWAKYHSPSQIPSRVGRFVRQAGADTMIQNAVRDKAQWAWIPSGDSCAFCITLASRGWQDASQKILKGRHAEHIHSNCDCTFAIAHNEKAKRDYDYIYDPDRYKEMYYGVEGDTPQERINAIRRMKYQQNREHINAQKRDAYLAAKMRSNNVAAISPADVGAVPDRFSEYAPNSKEARQKMISVGVAQDKPVFIKQDDDAYQFYQAVPPKENYYDVVLHGTPDGMGLEFFGEKMDPDTLCAIIRQRSDYHRGMSIRLISCYSGSVENGVAQYVADTLGVKVEAPTTKLYIYPPKNNVSVMIPETKPYRKDGKWKTFSGGKR